MGDVPEWAPSDWDLRVDGLVEHPFTLGFDELTAMPELAIERDIHCVTKWSKFDTHWTGVPVPSLLDRAGLLPQATHVVTYDHQGYSANLPLADATAPGCIVAYAYEGEPIEAVHGGPVRLVIPHLYFWKSTKWLRRIELVGADRPGFWEQNGYHMYGDPFREQRFTND